MKRLPVIAGHLSVVCVALFWSFTGLSKLADVVLPATRSADQWINRFPVPVVAAGAALELFIGAAILLGYRLAGLLGGSLLLAVFTALLVAYPPAPGQSCGCLGSTVDGNALAAMEPLVRNAFLGTMHILGLSSVFPARRGPISSGVAASA